MGGAGRGDLEKRELAMSPAGSWRTPSLFIKLIYAFVARQHHSGRSPSTECNQVTTEAACGGQHKVTVGKVPGQLLWVGKLGSPQCKMGEYEKMGGREQEREGKWLGCL